MTVATSVGRGLGATTRRAIQVVGWPYRALGRLLGRSGRYRRARDSGASFQAADLAADEGLFALADALSHPVPHVRAQALDVICELAGDRAARFLSAVLCDPDPGVRCAAASAAGRIGASGTVFSLILALDDPAPHVRRAVADAIAAVTGKRPELDGTEDRERLLQEIEELKGWWKEQRFGQLQRHLGVELGGEASE